MNKEVRKTTKKAINLEGRQFGVLYVTGRDLRENTKSAYWNCMCSHCGTESSVASQRIRTCPKSCVHCKMEHRVFPKKLVNCNYCGAALEVPSNRWVSYCNKECRSKEANIRVVDDRRSRTVEGLVTLLVSQTRSRAKRKGWKHDLTVDYLLQLLVEQDGKCPRTGVTLLASRPLGKSRAHPHTVSIDRVDPNLGYVMGNVELVSYIMNIMKNAFTHEDLEEFCMSYIETKKARELSSEGTSL